MSIHTQFSLLRLQGEPLPQDLAVLLLHQEELQRRTGVRMSAEPQWTPWLDTSYLTEAERADPEIAANIRAIAEVCRHVAFVVADDEGNYFGYWRGPSLKPIAESVVVQLDSEGQFSVCGTANIAGAILTQCCYGGTFDETRQWFLRLGLTALPTYPYDLGNPQVTPTPTALHQQLFEAYLHEVR
ncbi:hypothetical protein [Acidovorax sp. Root275]|uniref:hypothetical protein n=1 Tax=Acidovorax sp. Root275 TaxID=1736508 RepID=UPI000AF43EE4|nr:hypothetical protein [Acidovorax sp. Root275]